MAKYYIYTQIESNIPYSDLCYEMEVYRDDGGSKFHALPLTGMKPVSSNYQTDQHETVDIPRRYENAEFIISVALYRKNKNGAYLNVTPSPITATYTLTALSSGPGLTTVSNNRKQQTNICYFETTAQTKNASNGQVNTTSLQISCQERVFIVPEHPVGDPKDPFEKSIIEQSVHARLNTQAGPLNTLPYPDQGRSSLCGPAAFFYSLLKDRPDLYAQTVKDLWGKGEAQLGQLKIEPDQDARRPKNYFYTAQEASRNPSLIDTPKVPPIDWITLASLRDSENVFFDYASPDNQLSGITMWGKIEEWYKAVGANKILSNIGLGTASKKDICDLNSHIDGKNHVVALIAANMLIGSMGGRYKNHWIVWEDKLRVQSTGAEVTLLTPSDAIVELKLFSWGEVRSRLKGSMTLELFLKHSFGALVFSKIP